MPIFPSIRRGSIRQLQLAGIGLIIASLGWQLQSLAQLRASHGNRVSSVKTPRLTPATASTATLTQLFAQPSNSVVAAPISTSVRLLACFVGPDSRQSSALLAIDGQPKRRVRTGEAIMPGVQVTAIQAQSIDLSRNGHVYRLPLGRGIPVPTNPQSAAHNGFAPTSMHSIASAQ